MVEHAKATILWIGVGRMVVLRIVLNFLHGLLASHFAHMDLKNWSVSSCVAVDGARVSLVSLLRFSM